MTPHHRDDRIDRYVRGELTPAEGRELAQESLDDPELFQELTDSALAAKGLWGRSRPAPESRPSGRLSFFPKRYVIVGALAAALAVAVSVGVVHNLRTPAARDLQPTLELARSSRQPVLLAAGLPHDIGPQPDVFRGSESRSRPPRDSGTVVQFKAGIATIDLGSLDGLSNGAALDVYRDHQSQDPIGRVTISTVFRDRARGTVEGRVHERDQVRVPADLQLAARMDQVHSLAVRGDWEGSRKAAEDNAQWAASANVPAYLQASAWNTLAALRLLQSDRIGAGVLLRRALAACAPSDPAYPQILNNLGVLAELNGDKRAALERYRSAARPSRPAADGVQTEQKVVESNLARIAR